MDWLCGYATIFLKGGQNHFLVTRHVTTYPATGWSPRLKEHAHTAQLRHSKPLGQESWKLSSQGFEWFTSGMLMQDRYIIIVINIISYQLYLYYTAALYTHILWLPYLSWSEDNSMLDQFSFGPIQMNGKPSFWFITALSTQAKIGWTYSLHLETDCSRDASSIDHLRPWNTNTKVQVELERNGLWSDSYWYYYLLYYLHYRLLVSTIYSILPMMPEKWTESRMHEELQWKHSSNIGANSQSCDSNQANITQAHQTMHLEEWYVDDAAMGIAWKLSWASWKMRKRMQEVCTRSGFQSFSHFLTLLIMSGEFDSLESINWSFTVSFDPWEALQNPQAGWTSSFRSNGQSQAPRVESGLTIRCTCWQVGP